MVAGPAKLIEGSNQGQLVLSGASKEELEAMEENPGKSGYPVAGERPGCHCGASAARPADTMKMEVLNNVNE